MPSWIVPSDAHSVGDTGHTTDHNHMADDLTLVNNVLPVVSGGLTGAVQAARFAGATTSGAPVSGTFAVGDFVIDRSGTVQLCITAGSPGTWTALVNTTAAQAISGLITFSHSGTQVLLQPSSGYANFTLTAPGDGAQFANFNLADGTYPLDQNPGGHYWAWSHRADSPAHRLMLFNYNGSGQYTNAFQILENGNLQMLSNSVTLAAGTATVAPLIAQSGTSLTTAAAGATEFDGTCFYDTAATSSRQVRDTEQLCTLTSGYTLTSQTAAQKLFNSTANGALTVQASTAYFFDCLFTLSSMSASSGAYGFAFGGTATLTSQLWETEGNKATLATAASPQNTVNTAANTAIVTATTATVGWARVSGKIRVNAGGTLIPQVSLGVAAAAAVGSDSYFRIWPAGASAVTSVGNWS